MGLDEVGDDTVFVSLACEQVFHGQVALDEGPHGVVELGGVLARAEEAGHDGVELQLEALRPNGIARQKQR